MQCRHSGSPLPKKAKTVPSAGKVMVSVFWDSDGVLLLDFLNKGQTITGNYYVNLVKQLREAIKEKRRGNLAAADPEEDRSKCAVPETDQKIEIGEKSYNDEECWVLSCEKDDQEGAVGNIMGRWFAEDPGTSAIVEHREKQPSVMDPFSGFHRSFASTEWPPYSPNLDQMDLSVWYIFQARACATRLKSLKLLKRSLSGERDRFSLEDLRPRAENFKPR
ncbi:hypothetical protein LAZ67_2001434 [Cordylochernes scorpioides]|uniref:Uncharacterized protein n=1 Tax=Cordylochernes scorpioides TaxID=51811 RepID=A0ABY6K177_9ARAC|nr:hypothetical protein LAZ67_2001434 [Cordylochernes scorpioides]